MKRKKHAAWAKANLISHALMRGALLLGLSGCLCCTHADAQTLNVDSLMRLAMKKFDVLGASLAVVKDGKTTHARGYGLNHALAFSPEVDGETLFGIASLSKAFTTAAVGILVDQGKLDWDTKVRSLVPEFMMYSEDVADEFTVADLLAHHSGLPLGAGDLMVYPQGGNFAITDVLSAFQHFEPEAPFREKFSYSNLHYLVAGEVVARVSGMGFEAFVERYIFQPMGFESSATVLSKALLQGDVALPHKHDGAQWNPIPFASTNTEMLSSAAGGLFSNAVEMATWMQLWISAYHAQPKYPQVLDQARVEEIWRIHTPLPEKEDHTMGYAARGYGLGWVVGTVHGHFGVWHTGGKPGMVCKVLLVPESKLGVVVMANVDEGGGALFESVTRSIADAYLGAERKDWISHYSAKRGLRAEKALREVAAVWRRADTLKVSSARCQKLVGTYTDPWFGPMVVDCEEGIMTMRALRSPLLHGRMYPLSPDSFAVKWAYRDMDADVFAIFSEAKNGTFHALKLKGISPLIDFSFDFHHLKLRREEEADSR